MRTSFFAAALSLTLSLSEMACAAPADTLCSDQPARLAARAGVYVTAPLIERVRQTRRWDLSQQGLPNGATELRVGADGSVGIAWNWHESAVLGREIPHGCLRFDGDQVRLQPDDLSKAGPLLRIAGLAGAADAPYFALLFSGCYRASRGGERWCFEPNRVVIAGRPRPATLKLDLSELPAGGSVLEVAGEDRFWLFVPRPDGWAVYRTTWASAPGYREPDWAQPWQLLKRAP